MDTLFSVMLMFGTDNAQYVRNRRDGRVARRNFAAVDSSALQTRGSTTLLRSRRCDHCGVRNEVSIRHQCRHAAGPRDEADLEEVEDSEEEDHDYRFSRERSPKL